MLVLCIRIVVLYLNCKFDCPSLRLHSVARRTDSIHTRKINFYNMRVYVSVRACMRVSMKYTVSNTVYARPVFHQFFFYERQNSLQKIFLTVRSIAAGFCGLSSMEKK